MCRSKEGILGFGRTDGRTDGQTDGRTDGQPENIMPPAPKGGGIKSYTHLQTQIAFLHHSIGHIPVEIG